MKKIFLLAVFALSVFGASSASKTVQKPVADVGDLLAVIDFCPQMPVETAEGEADAFMANAVKVMEKKGFKRGLTGDGYGGPCVIIDGFYKGGVPDTTRYCFVPGALKDQACVVEIAACNDGEDGDYEVFVTVELFTEQAARAFMRQFDRHGFKCAERDSDGNSASYGNGKYVIDYSHETGYADDCHYFTIQTVARKQRITNF